MSSKWNFSAVRRVGLIIKEPLEEGIAGLWLSREAKSSLVFAENQVLVVQQNDTLILYVAQTGYAVKPTTRVRLLVPTVCNDRDIRVYDYFRLFIAHSERPCLFNAASLIAAISPNWSPKKSFGQLEMFPNLSTSSRLRLELPSGLEEQKYRATSS